MDTLSISGVFLKKQLVESELRRLDRAIEEQAHHAHTESELANLAAMRMCRASLRGELGQRTQRTPHRTPGGSLRTG